MAAPPRFKATPIRLATLRDFTGGLNLRADAFQLAPNESPDMLNVDVEIGGGFIQRRSVQPFGSGPALPANPVAIFTLPTSSGEIIVQCANRTLQLGSGAAWALITTFATSGVTARGTIFNNLFYGVHGPDASFRFNPVGNIYTAMGTAFNNTSGGEGANDGNLPIASYICTHMQRVFIAGTNEGGTLFPNRIRWSHPGFPEDWRANDFIDIDIGHDSDVITAIVPFRERLYIFKNNSISVLTGYGPENFQVVPLMNNVGAVSQEATVVTPVGLFFFSWPDGVYLDKGSGPYPIFDKIQPWIRDAVIPATQQQQICMGYMNRKVFASVPYSGSTNNTRTLVYNPWIWRHRYMRFLEGPWYVFDTPISCYAQVNQIDNNQLWLVGNSGAPYIGQIEQPSANDNWGTGVTAIQAHYTTAWEDIGQEAVFKRWRHPDIVMRSGFVGNVMVDVKKDYDSSKIAKTFWVAGSAAITGLVWADQINIPVISSVTQVGTPGSTPYTYRVSALNANGETIASPEVTTTTGNQTLSVTNYNVITWGAVAGATSYNVYGGNAGAEILVGFLVAGTTFNDQGVLHSGYPPIGPTAWVSANGRWDDGSGLVGGAWQTLPQFSETIARGASLGTGRAIQMTFTGPVNTNWGVDALTLKYIPKRIRG